ncbi:MAG TPA: PEGA domain-containing protein [Candidatus Saccharimonas sp.]|nr:PEGA domain-containing protein [Candidatus Saccharimonas sp.]
MMLRRILLVLGYLAVAAVVVLGTIGMVAYGEGYTYNFRTGQIIRTGLVIIQSVPSGAGVTFDGKKLKKKTTYRQSLEAGSYTYELNKDGFYPWKKVLSVMASEVTLVQYALLVPKQPATSIVTTTPAALVSVAESKDHRHVVYATVAPDSAVYVVDNNGSPRKVFAAPVATASAPAETVSEVSWSDDASHILVVTQAAGHAVHWVVPAGGGDAINLTERFGFDLSGLRFSGYDWSQMFWISPDGLRRLDVDAQTVSAVLADKVRQFQVAGDRVLYVQTTDLGPSLWSLDRSGRRQELIQALPESEAYALEYTSYRGHDELAVVPSRTQVGTLYSDIFSNNPVSKTIAHGVTGASFSPDGHLLAFSGPGAVVTYDLERSSLTDRLVSYEFGGVANLASMSWYDNFHLLRNQGGRLLFGEYDGANTYDLGGLSGGFAPFSSADLSAVEGFEPTADGAGTQLMQLVVKP